MSSAQATETIATMLHFVNSTGFSNLCAHIFHTDTVYVIRLQQVQKFIASNTQLNVPVVYDCRPVYFSLFVHSFVLPLCCFDLFRSSFFGVFFLYVFGVCVLRILQNTVTKHLWLMSVLPSNSCINEWKMVGRLKVILMTLHCNRSSNELCSFANILVT